MRESSNVPRDTSSRLVSFLLPSYRYNELSDDFKRVWESEDLPLRLSLDFSDVRQIHTQPRHHSPSSLLQDDTIQAHAETDAVKAHSAIVEL